VIYLPLIYLHLEGFRDLIYIGNKMINLILERNFENMLLNISLLPKSRRQLTLYLYANKNISVTRDIFDFICTFKKIKYSYKNRASYW
jgi:hypothetical protein